MNISEALLSRLQGVKGRDGRWVARCPSHDDGSPSLTVKAMDSRVLIHCFAGCTPETVLQSVGLSMSDLFADSKSQGDVKVELRKTANQSIAEWVEMRMMQLAITLRTRDAMLRLLGDREDDLALTWKAHCYRNYDLLEWEFQTLRTGTSEQKVRLWRER
jgi:hypothetical protein